MDDAEDLRGTSANKAWSATARGLLQSALMELCRKGYYGEITLRLSAKDGTIQLAETEKRQSHRPKG